jgi:predicted nuclease with TOPRIM domain
MKQVLSILSIAILLFSCGNAELEEKVKQLEKENAELNEELGSETSDKEAATARFTQAINEIEDNIDQLDLQQEALNIEMQSGIESSETGKDRILNKIQLINTMLEKDKSNLSKLANDLSKNNYKITGLQQSISALQERLANKDIEIEGLKQNLVQLNYKIDDLNVTVDSLTFIAELQKEVLQIQRDEIETAYYCYGTKRELKENNIITREGGLIGLGKTTKLSKDFNHEYFEKINIKEITEIPLASEKAKLITNHPSDSYEFQGEGTIEKIVITDPITFWETSKFLVIVVE